jgi:uncharacterized cupin superfamily protein
MTEAVLQNGIPVTAGWFAVNVRDACWLHNRMGSVCRFGGEEEAHFDDLGVSLFWLQPGRPMSLYHHEAGQEDFLVLAGECTLIIEGEERRLHAWDFVHCPPRTAHTIVAATERPALVFAVGARKEKGSARYPVDPVAIAHGAGVPDESTGAQDVYASFGQAIPGRAPDIFSSDGEDFLST